MQLPRRHFLQFAGAAAAPALITSASALDYPTHSVRIVVGFPPGGPTDIYARLIGQWLSARLGQPFVIENRPGAGSTIGVEAVVSSPPDGYTLLLVSTSATVAASYYRNLSFNLVRDIAPVCGISLEPAAKDTPAEIVDRLNKEVNAALTDPTMKGKLANLGGMMMPGTPADFGKSLADETDKWVKVVREANIKPME